MRRLLYFWPVLFILVAGIASGVVSMNVSKRYDHVQELQKQMRSDRKAIRMLETELTYRASPQRLQALIDAHGLNLGLPKADQYLVSAVDLAPQPGDPALVGGPPLFATAPTFIAPVPATTAPPVQLASLSSRHAEMDIADQLEGRAGVAFAEPPLLASVDEKVKLPVASSSTPPRAATAAGAVAPKKQQPHVPAAKPELPKKEIAVVAKPKHPQLAKETAAKPALAPHLTVMSPAIAAKPSSAPKETSPRRLDAALIASIETAAAKEARAK
jgi:hypothetical protein